MGLNGTLGEGTIAVDVPGNEDHPDGTIRPQVPNGDYPSVSDSEGGISGHYSRTIVCSPIGRDLVLREEIEVIECSHELTDTGIVVNDCSEGVGRGTNRPHNDGEIYLSTTASSLREIEDFRIVGVVQHQSLDGMGLPVERLIAIGHLHLDP